MTWVGWILAAWFFGAGWLANYRRQERDRVRCVEDESAGDSLRAVANAIVIGVSLADDADALRGVAEMLEGRWGDGE